MSTTSQIEAWSVADLSGRAAEVYECIAIADPEGVINDEIVDYVYRDNIIPSAAANMGSAVTTLRERGVVKDSGRKREGATGMNQAVWVLGDDRHVVFADRVRSLKTQAARIGYGVYKLEETT